MKNQSDNFKKTAYTVSIVTIIANTFLSIFKLIAGLVGKSSAMISDSVHSFSDVFSTIIVIIGVKLSSKGSDKQHRYGHERLESAASMLLAMILLITGIGIGYGGVLKIIEGAYGDLQVPSMLALIAAIISIAIKEGMFWYTRHYAIKINSSSLRADAWHHRSDALSSIGSFAGILGAQLGFPILDPIASLIICLFIAKAAYDIFKDGLGRMVDKSCDDKTILQIKEIILKQNGVLGIDDLKTRLFGSKIYIDVEIEADGNLTLYESHLIAENVHNALEKELETVKHCMVHVNPADVEKIQNKINSDNKSDINESN